MASARLTTTAEDALRAQSPSGREETARALDLLEDDNFREENKIDLNLREEGQPVFALVVGRVWIGFLEDQEGLTSYLSVLHLSLRSRFRPF